MCYTILLSTSSSEDLSVQNCALVHFDKNIPECLSTNRLLYPHVWRVGSRSGCSCSFRHLYSVELGFGEPVDWYPEESEDIAATLTFVKIVKSILAQGAYVDCLDVWGQQEEASFPSRE